MIGHAKPLRAAELTVLQSAAMTTDTLDLALAPSPWRTVWFSPRLTIRRIIDAVERPSFVLVVAVACVSSALGGVQQDETGAISAAASTMPVIVGGLQLVFGVLIGPFILAFVGGMLGGEADPTELRHAVAWSYVPTVVALVFWIPALMFLPGAAEIAADEDSGTAIGAALGVTGVLTCGLWSIVILIAMIAEVQRFSVVKAIANVALPGVPFLLLSLLT